MLNYHPEVILPLVLIAWLGSAGPAPDYADLYARGVPFTEFLAKATSKRDEWRDRYRDAVVPPDLVQQARALPAKYHVLVVAEDWCSDSAQSIPYLARLVDEAPDSLEMRVINSKVGRSVMDAHPTPDGRGATPTVVLLTADGRLVGAWSERPSELEAWSIEQRRVLSQRDLHDQMAKWYAADAGKSALSEILTLLAR